MTHAVYAGSSRFTTSGLDRFTRHSFSFGEHYDPANLGFGPMICHNDDLLDPGGGYPDHPHADLEIVTWVLDGVLLHTDDAGNTEELHPGHVQVMSAGAGIRHAEMADVRSGPTRFLQTWIRPDESGTPPGWRSEHVDPGSGLTTVVGDGALAIGTRGASLSVARLQPGMGAQLPDAGRATPYD
jgi:redox-sensitive bicupin YhaK (pirin superfamily)